MKVYKDFSEIEHEISDVSQNVYKYRSWKDKYHRSIITDYQIWFAHPHSLNDDQDLRLLYRFTFENMDWIEFRSRLMEVVQRENSHWDNKEILNEVERCCLLAKADPETYFEKNRANYNADPANFERLGIFSTCRSGVNREMWKLYADNFAGFAVGFSTVELMRSLQCTCGVVEYSDEPLQINPLSHDFDEYEIEVFRKQGKWSHEEEFRIMTPAIGFLKERACRYDPMAVSELLIGYNASGITEKEVIEARNNHLPEVPIYKIVENPDGELLKLPL